MLKMIFAALFAAVICLVGVSAKAQKIDKNPIATVMPAVATDVPTNGVAPNAPNGVGRADVRVFDEQGRPLKNVYVHLTSKRTDGFRCESWNWTDDRGLANLMPLHMNRLTFDIRAKGYRKRRVRTDYTTLNSPIRVTLVKK